MPLPPPTPTLPQALPQAIPQAPSYFAHLPLHSDSGSAYDGYNAENYFYSSHYSSFESEIKKSKNDENDENDEQKERKKKMDKKKIDVIPFLSIDLSLFGPHDFPPKIRKALTEWYYTNRHLPSAVNPTLYQSPDWYCPRYARLWLDMQHAKIKSGTFNADDRGEFTQSQQLYSHFNMMQLYWKHHDETQLSKGKKAIPNGMTKLEWEEQNKKLLQEALLPYFEIEKIDKDDKGGKDLERGRGGTKKELRAKNRDEKLRKKTEKNEKKNKNHITEIINLTTTPLTQSQTDTIRNLLSKPAPLDENGIIIFPPADLIVNHDILSHFYPLNERVRYGKLSSNVSVLNQKDVTILDLLKLKHTFLNQTKLKFSGNPHGVSTDPLHPSTTPLNPSNPSNLSELTHTLRPPEEENKVDAVISSPLQPQSTPSSLPPPYHHHHHHHQSTIETQLAHLRLQLDEERGRRIAVENELNESNQRLIQLESTLRLVVISHNQLQQDFSVMNGQLLQLSNWAQQFAQPRINGVNIR
jgi:hypothetical protein